MSDHEFEKKVQSSLEQLKLRPSVAVWAAVESNIRKEKRRRRMILWLPICFLFLGAGGYFMLQGKHASPQQDVAAQTTAPSSSTTSSNANTTISDNNSTLTKDNNTVTAPEVVKEATTQPEAPATAAKSSVTETAKPAPVVNVVKEKKAIIKEQQPAAIIAKKEKPQQRIKQSNRKGQQKDNQLVVQSPIVEKGNQHEATNTGNEVVQQVPVNVTNALTDSTLINTTPDTAVAMATITVDSAALAMSAPVDSVTKDVAELVKQPEAPAMAPLKVQQQLVRPKRGRWQWGVQAEGGYSGITQDGLFAGLFGFLKNTSTVEKVADLTQASPLNNGMSNAYAPQFPRPVNKPSEITMGPSFAVGGFVQRTLSRRIALSVGIQYAYQSVRTVVGAKVNNTRTINRAPATAQLVSSYYDANNTENYTNQYHFIEIPVTLHAKLNKGMRLPLVWDIGFSAARMISTNALHYDGLGGVYYKDNNLFNKTQWVVATGFNIGLFQKAKHPLSIGPSVRYNMNNLLKKDFNTGQHLWSVGLKASVLLRK